MWVRMCLCDVVVSLRSEFTMDSSQFTEEENRIDLSLTSTGGLRANTSVEIGESLCVCVCVCMCVCVSV